MLPCSSGPDTAFVHIKSRLVPFVERTPYLEYLRFLRGWEIDLGGGFGSFGKPLTPPTPLPLYPDNTPVTVGVCYESIFTHDLRQRKGYLLGILTNDGWWKKSSGYYQHFSYGRLSAQSLGLPMARSANTGISAFIWPDGTVKALLPYDTRGLLYAKVPVSDIPKSVCDLWRMGGFWGMYLCATVMDSVVVSRRALEDLLREVGAYLRTQAQSFSRHEAEYKTARDPVSYVDRTAEALLQEGCHRLPPRSGLHPGRNRPLQLRK
jgi:apolipoprotein N-acyltransferase